MSAMASKASLVGMKTVISGVESMVSTKPALVRAPTMPVSPAAVAVVEALVGMVRTESIL